MKKHILFVILGLFSIYSFSQNKWEEKEDELWDKMQQKIISKKEWFLKIQTEAGEIPNRLSAWYKKTSKIQNPNTDKIEIQFKKENLKISENGNVYREMVIKNNTKDTIRIERIDSTIGGLQESFMINGKWIKNRKNGASSCGNSYFTQFLSPHNQIEFELSNGGLTKGEIEVNYKILLTIDKKTFESNVIKVNLYKNQFKRLKEKFKNY